MDAHSSRSFVTPGAMLAGTGFQELLGYIDLRFWHGRGCMATLRTESAAGQDGVYFVYFCSSPPSPSFAEELWQYLVNLRGGDNRCGI